MPKHKTHSGMSKRVRITGSGKLLRQQANRRHNFERKPTSLTRRLDGLVVVDSADAVKVRRLLGK